MRRRHDEATEPRPASASAKRSRAEPTARRRQLEEKEPRPAARGVEPSQRHNMSNIDREETHNPRS